MSEPDVGEIRGPRSLQELVPNANPERVNKVMGMPLLGARMAIGDLNGILGDLKTSGANQEIIARAETVVITATDGVEEQFKDLGYTSDDVLGAMLIQQGRVTMPPLPPRPE